jgi:adenine deaminase
MDLVVRNVDLVNVFTAEIYRADLGIKGDRYAAVARYEDGTPAFELQGFREIDGTGRVAMPGFVDSHVLSLAGIALPVIPEVKITDLGLVHVTSQQLLPLFPAA